MLRNLISLQIRQYISQLLLFAEYYVIIFKQQILRFIQQIKIIN